MRQELDPLGIEPVALERRGSAKVCTVADRMEGVEQVRLVQLIVTRLRNLAPTLREVFAASLVECRHLLDVALAVPAEADRGHVVVRDPGLLQTEEEGADREAARRRLDSIEPFLFGESNDFPVAD